jgi:DNA-directed RNA polymerase subunit alpha
MTTVYGTFQMPEAVVVEESTPTFGRFVAEPFERGFGHTLGNSLRRMLLSALEAPAVIGLTIEGVAHEFAAVEGIVEDVTQIILNLKGALIRRLPMQGDPMARDQKLVTTMLEVKAEDLKRGGQKAITLGDLVRGDEFELLNPELHIFTITQPVAKRVDLRIGTGRGYVPAERLYVGDRQKHEILIDAAYSPVRLVNYFVEATRVGRDTDFDRLVLEIETDGRIAPKEALSFAVQIMEEHLKPFSVIHMLKVAFEEPKAFADADRDELLHKLRLRINDIELSVRASNCLSGAEIETIGELVVMPEAELLKFRNFGKKSLTEIKTKLSEMGLGLGMDLAAYGITRENVRDVLRLGEGEEQGSEQQPAEEEIS